MADALTWMCIKDNNAFLYKRGRTNRAGCVMFSAEPGNLTNVSSFKYSGLANSKTVDFAQSKEGKYPTVVMTTKRTKALNQPKKTAVPVTLNRSYRTTSNSIVNSIVKTHYRADLKAAALKRFAALQRVTKVEAGIKKGAKPKRGRVSK